MRGVGVEGGRGRARGGPSGAVEGRAVYLEAREGSLEALAEVQEETARVWEEEGEGLRETVRAEWAARREPSLAGVRAVLASLGAGGAQEEAEGVWGWVGGVGAGGGPGEGVARWQKVARRWERVRGVASCLRALALREVYLPDAEARVRESSGAEARGARRRAALETLLDEARAAARRAVGGVDRGLESAVLEGRDRAAVVAAATRWREAVEESARRSEHDVWSGGEADGERVWAAAVGRGGRAEADAPGLQTTQALLGCCAVVVAEDAEGTRAWADDVVRAARRVLDKGKAWNASPAAKGLVWIERALRDGRWDAAVAEWALVAQAVASLAAQVAQASQDAKAAGLAADADRRAVDLLRSELDACQRDAERQLARITGRDVLITWGRKSAEPPPT